MINFENFDFHPLLSKAIAETGYKQPTPIQAQAIPVILNERDLLGIAQTGTGKTAAFALPILQLLQGRSAQRAQAKHPRCLILTPTRELAIQIHKNLNDYGKFLKLKSSVIFGGVSQVHQVRELQSGVDILVATPGRLLDLISQKHLFLNKIEIFVLDEADRMLDMGFFQDIKKVIPLLPKERHTLFFSATMPKEIESLALTLLKDHETVEVTPPATTVERIEQKVMFVEQKDKMSLLISLLNNNKEFKKVLVFVEMKHVANKVVDRLLVNRINAVAIHSNKSQSARQKALESFTNNQTRVLVATEIASRGIDVDGITHVINYELPNVPDNYVHRIGRTARAGTQGKAISFCNGIEKSYLAHIEKVTQQKIDVDTTHAFHSQEAMQAGIMRPGKAKATIEGASRSSHSSRPPQRNARRPRSGSATSAPRSTRSRSSTRSKPTK